MVAVAKSGIKGKGGGGGRGASQRLTQQQRADGGRIARCRSAVVTSSSSGQELKLNYGMGLARDPRVLSTLQRESFFLTVLRPRSDTCSIAIRSLVSYFTLPRVAILSALLGLFVSVSIACANADPNELGNTFCTGGPLGTGITFSDYRPVILNSLAAMVLSFYVSAVVNEYKATYYACGLLRSQLVQFTTFSTAEMSDQPGGSEVLFDIWRSLNLMHIATYCLADKRREVCESSSRRWQPRCIRAPAQRPHTLLRPLVVVPAQTPLTTSYCPCRRRSAHSTARRTWACSDGCALSCSSYAERPT